MSTTVNGDSEDSARVVSLAQGLRNDTPQDSRDCPHECHGSLSLEETDCEEDRVICESCRCTPDGVFFPPKDDIVEGDDEDGDNGKENTSEAASPHCSQHTFFNPNSRSRRSRLRGSNPHPSRGVNGTPDRYSHSDTVILPGGHQKVYDENHPAGGTDEYVFDISSL